jgi:hypothetical protein
MSRNGGGPRRRCRAGTSALRSWSRSASSSGSADTGCRWDRTGP